MESLLIAGDVLIKKYKNFGVDFSYPLFIYGIILLLVLVVLLHLLSVFYSKIRKKFSVKVNCWFCCENTKVPYELSNSWDCPSCKQYNGFNKDGDYNKVIKEQYNSKFNETDCNNLKNSYKCSENNSAPNNGFCRLCNINQQLKIQQLALFVPLNELNYDEEVEEYRQKLENAYKLCSQCEAVVKETLEKQEYSFLQNKLNIQNQKPYEVQNSEGHFQFYKWKEIFFSSKRKYAKGMEWICLCLAVLLLFALIVQFETENQVFRGALLPALYFESLHSILMIIVKFGQKIYEFSRELALGAIFLSLVYYGDGQRKIKQMSLIAWSLLYVLLWSNLTGIQILICGACAILNHQAIQNKKIYLCKKSLPKKFSFQPEKCNFFGDEVLSNYEIQSPKFCTSKKESNYSSPVHVGKVAENKKIENVNNKLSPLSGSTKEVKKKIKKKENEIESLSNEEFKSEPAPSIKATNINSSVFSKSFLASLESDKTNREDSSTLDDFYSHLSSLNLGKKQKKSKKPSNFLFESHNFAEKKYSSSIIKPAKFIKNLSSSWTCTESNDSISRSSTPSSGYSSQKQEPIRFEFNKTMSPISVSPLPRRDFCDYFEGNNRLYNFNCYPNEFVMPFQQCQGPMGHTTVYTCTRPPSLPFPFSPQGFSSYRFPSSPRSSDVSESENLFQNTSRNFEKSQKWNDYNRLERTEN